MFQWVGSKNMAEWIFWNGRGCWVNTFANEIENIQPRIWKKEVVVAIANRFLLQDEGVPATPRSPALLGGIGFLGGENDPRGGNLLPCKISTLSLLLLCVLHILQHLKLSFRPCQSAESNCSMIHFLRTSKMQVLVKLLIGSKQPSVRTAKKKFANKSCRRNWHFRFLFQPQHYLRRKRNYPERMEKYGNFVLEQRTDMSKQHCFFIFPGSVRSTEPEKNNTVRKKTINMGVCSCALICRGHWAINAGVYSGFVSFVWHFEP